MKNKIIFIIVCIFILSGCDKQNIYSNKNDEQINNNLSEVTNNLKLIINEKEYSIILENNETAKEFANLLPLEFNMNELNGNEKYVYLDNNLPINSNNPGHINVGDVMLYGDNCLVIFYKSFDTPYSYTKIGYIDNLPNLGTETIKVKIEK